MYTPFCEEQAGGEILSKTNTMLLLLSSANMARVQRGDSQGFGGEWQRKKQRQARENNGHEA